MLFRVCSFFFVTVRYKPLVMVTIQGGKSLLKIDFSVVNRIADPNTMMPKQKRHRYREWVRRKWIGLCNSVASIALRSVPRKALFESCGLRVVGRGWDRLVQRVTGALLPPSVESRLMLSTSYLLCKISSTLIPHRSEDYCFEINCGRVVRTVWA